MRGRLAPGAALALALLAAACVEGPPSDCESAAVRREVSLADGRLDPSTIAVCRGQRVTLTVKVEQDGVFHVHSYDDALPAREVRAGEDAVFEFVAARSGQFVIELHPTGDDEGGEAGVLTVHEP